LDSHTPRGRTARPRPTRRAGMMTDVSL
jgi:hypothetical protein